MPSGFEQLTGVQTRTTCGSFTMIIGFDRDHARV